MPEPVTHSAKCLWLLRHAKATQHGHRGGRDYDRPLTNRGRRDAKALGARLADGAGVFGLDGVALPQVAVTSAAARTSETAQLVADGMAAPPSIESYRSMYEGGTETILQYVRELEDGVISAMVVGHNPTIYRLAWGLLATDATVGSGLGSDAGSGGESGSDGESGSNGESGSGSGGELDGRHRLEEHGFPTCTVAVLVLPVSSWSETTEESASLAGVFSPPY